MNVKNNQVLKFDEAVSYKLHSRLFEILGYLSFIDREKLSINDRNSIIRIEEISRTLLSEIHEIIDAYRK